MAVILRKRSAGNQCEFIDQEELDKMLSARSAALIPGMTIYEELETPAKAKPPEDLDSVVDEEAAPPQVYETRELKAAPKPRRRQYRKKKPPALTPVA